MPDAVSDHDIIHSLGDDLPVGLWVARVPDGTFVYANARFAQIMGQTGRDDVGVGAYSEPYGIVTRDGKPYPEDKLPFTRAVQARAIVVVDDLSIRRPDRSMVHVRAFANPVITAAGELSHVVIAFFDITREVEAERAKAESDRRLQSAQRLEAVGTLAGGIAHDFNNLIFGIKLLASELSVGESDPRRRAALALIDDITVRSALLTRSLLGFARRDVAHPMPIALDDVLGAMRELFARTMPGVTIGFELGADARGSLRADRAQLEQVVMNLVVNARDALGDAADGQVMIRTRSRGAWVILEVSDNGPGIPMDLRERVFEPYFSTKTQSADRGTGLGLATVFGIVQAHHGEIEIDGGLDGRGTTMRVKLPSGPEAPRTITGPVATAASGSGVVLVVDDDEIVRRSLGRALANIGYKALVAGSGAEAIELFAREAPNIRGVLLDMIMPGMNGTATFHALRAIRRDLPILLMSGHAPTGEVEALIAAGARGMVEKPYSLDALGHAMEDAFGRPR